ncbi:hypothetical protein HDU86_007230 [Geranomyces michiganensis]|nr:hypothetical protein HDU86_007230 [Geranomyces michiganensis]
MKFAVPVCVALAAAYAHAAPAKCQPDTPAVKASATLTRDLGFNATEARGAISFTQTAAGTSVHVKLAGFTPGLHGVHVHGGVATSVGGFLNCTAAGGHYNPFNMTHGGLNDAVRHVGDLGNVVVGADGTVEVDISTKLDLAGETSVIGRTFVVHSAEDDLGKTDNPDSKKTGNAGKRVACGTIVSA